MIDEKKLIEHIKGMPDTCNLFRWRSPNKIKQGITSIIAHEPKIDEWIPCSVRFPEEKINPVTNDFYEYQVTFRSDDVTDIRHYKFGRGHWLNGPGIMDEYVTAWKPIPEPYKA